MIVPNYQTLLVQESAEGEVATGNTYTIIPSNGGEQNFEQEFYVVYQLILAGGATSPTLDAKLQTSWDGDTWHDLAAMTQPTVDGNSFEIKQLASSAALGPKVRAVVTPGEGSGGPATFTGTVLLASTEGFSLQAA